MKDTLQAFVVTVEVTGGVRVANQVDGTVGYEPRGEPGWLDLGSAYVDACKSLGIPISMGTWSQRADWRPCDFGCEGWHIFSSDDGRPDHVEACDESGRFFDHDGVSRDDWAESYTAEKYGNLGVEGLRNRDERNRREARRLYMYGEKSFTPERS